MTDQSRPDIYDYLDLIQYLNDVFRFRKTQDSAFSYSTWVLELGLGSKTALRFILKRQRRISPRSAALILKQLGFEQHEGRYFEALLAYTQAKTEREKQAFGAALIKAQKARYEPIEINDDAVLKSALSPVVLTLLGFEDVAGDAKSLSLMMDVDVSVIQSCLSDLETSGFIQVDALGKYSFNQAGFRVTDKPGSKSLRRYHEYWIERAKKSIDLPANVRKFRALKFALTEDEFSQALERINEFALSLLSSFNSRTIADRRLYMLETLFFPVTTSQVNTSRNVDAVSRIQNADAGLP
jgi:uncharacterized protein (TIGR02147 family)